MADDRAWCTHGVGCAGAPSLLGENPGMFEKHPEELEAVTSFLSTSICYYMIDFVYYRKTLSGEQVKRDVQFMMRAMQKRTRGLPYCSRAPQYCNAISDKIKKYR